MSTHRRPSNSLRPATAALPLAVVCLIAAWVAMATYGITTQANGVFWAGFAALTSGLFALFLSLTPDEGWRR